MNESKQRVKFGNWLANEPTRIGGLSLVAWAILAVSIVAMMFSFLLQRWAAGLMSLVLGLIIVMVFMVRWGSSGRTWGARIFDAISRDKRLATGSSQYQSGLFSALPAGQLFALPGALSNIEERDGIDGRGVPYTLVVHPSTKQLAATFMSAPDGIALEPQENIDQSVSAFGGFLLSLSLDTAIAGATVIVDSAFTSKEPMEVRLRERHAAGVPEIARQHFNQAMEALPNKVTETRAYATIIWDQDALGDDLDEAEAEVAAKLPHHVSLLEQSGAGTTEVACSSDLARIVQIAYNPDRASEFATDDLQGNRNPLRLVEAGPDYFSDAAPRVAFHDGVASFSVMMTVPPRMQIYEDTFAGLFAPHPKFLRKRVACFYRPYSRGDSISKARSMRQSANMTATSRGMASSSDEQRVRVSKHTEESLVAGASLMNFAIMVTVTFEANEKAYREAMQGLKSLLQATDLSYRYVNTGVSASFHSTLPLGILPWTYEGLVGKFAEGL